MSRFVANSVYDGYQSDVRRLLQGGRTSKELRAIGTMRSAHRPRSLSDDAVLAIRQRVARGELQARLATEFGVANGVISAVMHGYGAYRSVTA